MATVSPAMEDPILLNSRISTSQEDILQQIPSFQHPLFSASPSSQPTCPVLCISDCESDDSADVVEAITPEARACVLQYPVVLESPDTSHESEQEKDEEEEGVEQWKEGRGTPDDDSNYNPAFESDRSQSPSTHRPWDGFGDAYSSALITQSQDVANMEPFPLASLLVSKMSRESIFASKFSLVNTRRKSEVSNNSTGDNLKEQENVDVSKFLPVTEQEGLPKGDEKQKKVGPASAELPIESMPLVANGRGESHVLQEVLGSSNVASHTKQDSVATTKMMPGKRTRSSSVDISNLSNIFGDRKRSASDDVIALASSIDVRHDIEGDNDEKNQWRSIYKGKADINKNPSTSLNYGHSERETKSERCLSTTEPGRAHDSSAEGISKTNNPMVEEPLGNQVQNVSTIEMLQLKNDGFSKLSPYALMDAINNCSDRLTLPNPHDPDLLSLAICSGVRLPLPLRDCSGKLITEMG